MILHSTSFQCSHLIYKAAALEASTQLTHHETLIPLLLGSLQCGILMATKCVGLKQLQSVEETHKKTVIYFWFEMVNTLKLIVSFIICMLFF